METKDYYAILGISEKATPEEIKSAYRQLALKYHPDRCPEEKKKECEEKFKDIAAAYYVLGNAQRRREYDDYKKGAYVFRSGQGAGDFASQTGFDFDDLMKHFSNLGGMTGRAKKGKAGRYFFFDDLSDIFDGMNSGQGDPTERDYKVYHFTDSSGQQKYDTDTYAEIKIPQKIAKRGGEVKVKLSDARTITLKINPQTANGQKLRLKGIGKMCPSCEHKGDLIITVHYSW